MTTICRTIESARLLILILAICCPLASSNAAILFEQPLAPMQPSSPFFNPFSDSNQLAADQFVLTLGNRITEVHWYGSFLGAIDPLNVGSSRPFTINFFENNLGVPGSQIGSSISVSASVVTEVTGLQGLTQDISPSDQIYEFKAPLDVTLSLNTTTWISILGDPITNQRFRWAFDSTGDYATNAQQGSGWALVGTNSFNLAFSLSGPESTTSAVPEPSTLSILALGGLAFATFTRRRKEY